LELCLPSGSFSFDGLLISSAIQGLALLWRTLVDNVLTWIRDTFALGIRSMPAFRLGDQVSMALDTKQELDNLPTTESEDQ